MPPPQGALWNWCLKTVCLSLTSSYWLFIFSLCMWNSITKSFLTRLLDSLLIFLILAIISKEPLGRTYHQYILVQIIYNLSSFNRDLALASAWTWNLWGKNPSVMSYLALPGPGKMNPWNSKILFSFVPPFIWWPLLRENSGRSYQIHETQKATAVHQ